MNCLHPSISQRLTPLVIGITPERRRAVLSIAQQASNWQDFLDTLRQGDFPLPHDAKTPWKAETRAEVVA